METTVFHAGKNTDFLPVFAKVYPLFWLISYCGGFLAGDEKILSRFGDDGKKFATPMKQITLENLKLASGKIKYGTE